jgi:hypothetical protein
MTPMRLNLSPTPLIRNRVLALIGGALVYSGVLIMHLFVFNSSKRRVVTTKDASDAEVDNSPNKYKKYVGPLSVNNMLMVTFSGLGAITIPLMLARVIPLMFS